ncbi:MAG: hypothetical protein ACI85Q_002639 [Salibacteraceae bacterium]|jgi:hypothetical protein
MKSILLTVSAFLLLQLPLQAQISISEKLERVQSSKYISTPNEILKELMPLMEKDSVVLISFSKSNGVMQQHIQTTKKVVLQDLATTGFKQRYFVLLIDRKAIVYFEN